MALLTPSFFDMSTVQDTCKFARKWAEAYAKKFHYAKSLAGLCAIASAKLFDMLQQQGYLPTLCVWHDKHSDAAHCFVALDGYILDITATQFGHPYSIAVVSQKSANKPHWKIDQQFYALDDFMAYQREFSWEKRSVVTDKSLGWNPAFCAQ